MMPFRGAKGAAGNYYGSSGVKQHDRMRSVRRPLCAPVVWSFKMDVGPAGLLSSKRLQR